MVYVLEAYYGEYEDYCERIIGIFPSLEEAQRAMQSFDFVEFFDYEDMRDARRDCFGMHIMSYEFGSIVEHGHVECRYEFPEKI